MYKHSKLLKESGADKQPINEAVARQKLSERNQLADKLIENFARNEMGTEKLAELASKDKGHARNVAILMENQKQLLESHYGANFKEDTQTSTDFKITPTNVIKVVRLGAANSNRGKIFKEVALVTMRDIMLFTQPEYAKSFRGAEAGQRMLENIKPNYASSFQEYKFTVTASNTFSVTNLSPAPVTRLRTSVIYNGKQVGSDNGSGGFNSINEIFDGANSTIDYVTGATTLTFTANLDPANDELSLEWIWDAEFETTYDDYGVLHIQTRVLTFQPVIQPLGYQYSTLASATLGSTGFGNYQEMIVKAIADAHSARKDHKAIQLARRLAIANPKFVFDAEWASVSDNDYNHVQRLTETIGNIGTTVYNELQRGGINTLVAGTRAVNYLAKHRKYERDFSQRRAMGTYLDGYLDKLPVYVCPNVPGLLKEDEVLATYKNPDEDGEPALVFGTYTELTAGLEYPEFYTRGNMATVEDVQIPQAKFLRMLEIRNIQDIYNP
jgi:hypothetical protein